MRAGKRARSIRPMMQRAIPFWPRSTNDWPTLLSFKGNSTAQSTRRPELTGRFVSFSKRPLRTNQLRAETSRADQATALAASETAAGEKAAATVRALRADLAEAQSGSKQAQAAAKETEAKLKQAQAAAKETEAKLKQALDATKKARADTKRVKASTSYRLGHRIVLLVKAPLLAARALRGTRLLIGRARSFGRAKARTLIVQASKALRLGGWQNICPKLPVVVQSLFQVARTPQPKTQTSEGRRTRARVLSGTVEGSAVDDNSVRFECRCRDRSRPCVAGRDRYGRRDGGTTDSSGSLCDPRWLSPGRQNSSRRGPSHYRCRCRRHAGAVAAGAEPVGIPSQPQPEVLGDPNRAQPVPSIAAPPGRVVEVVDYENLPNPASRPGAFRELVQSYLGLLDISALHDGDYVRAPHTRRCCRLRRSVSCPDAPALVPILPHSVAESFAATDPRALTCEIEAANNGLDSSAAPSSRRPHLGPFSTVCSEKPAARESDNPR